MWVSLKDLPTLGAFLRLWGNEQHDLHEFLSRFLQWIQPRCVNSSWRRIVQEKGKILSKGQGSPYNPPTLSAPANTEKIELQHLVDSWTEYMGMQTTFTACSRLACLHIDRFALDHQGRPLKREWDTEINPTVWPPTQAEEELGFTHKPFTVVAAVAHQERDAAGHLQAVGLSAQRWLMFNDLQEAQVMGPTPPRTSEWIFVWLARDDSVELGLNRFGLTGTDLFPRTLATLYELHQMKLENYPEDVLARLRSFCSICGKLVVSHDALKKHARLRHSELGQVIKVDQFMQEHRDCANLPCHGCGAC